MTPLPKACRSTANSRADRCSRLPLLRRLVHAIWAQYPNPEYPKGRAKIRRWLIRPEPPIWYPAQQAPQAARSRAADWLGALVTLELTGENADGYVAEQPEAELRAARAELLLRVAVLRTLGRLAADDHGEGRREAVLAIFALAFVGEGLVRDECGARCATSEARLSRRWSASTTIVRTTAFACAGTPPISSIAWIGCCRASSGGCGRRPPPRRILHTYGEVLAIDAIEAVLDQVGLPRIACVARRAGPGCATSMARHPASPKRKRKLPGGREERRERRLSKLSRYGGAGAGQDLSGGAGSAPDAKLSPRAQSEGLFAHYDRRREANFDQIFESAQGALTRGELARAVDEFSWILANKRITSGGPRWRQPLPAMAKPCSNKPRQRAGPTPLFRPRPGTSARRLILDPRCRMPADCGSASTPSTASKRDGRGRWHGRPDLGDGQQPGGHQRQHQRTRHPSQQAALAVGGLGVLATGSLLLGLLFWRSRRRIAPALGFALVLLGSQSTGCLIPHSLSEDSPSDGGTLLIVKGASPRLAPFIPQRRWMATTFRSMSSAAHRRWRPALCAAARRLLQPQHRRHEHRALPVLRNSDGTGERGQRYTIDFRQPFPPCTLGFAGKMGYLIPVLATGGFPRRSQSPLARKGLAR